MKIKALKNIYSPHNGTLILQGGEVVPVLDRDRMTVDLSGLDRWYKKYSLRGDQVNLTHLVEEVAPPSYWNQEFEGAGDMTRGLMQAHRCTSWDLTPHVNIFWPKFHTCNASRLRDIIAFLQKVHDEMGEE